MNWGIRVAAVALALAALLGGSAQGAPSTHDKIVVENVAIDGAMVSIRVRNAGTTQLGPLVVAFPLGTTVKSIRSLGAATVCNVSNEGNAGLCLYLGDNAWAPGETQTVTLELAAPPKDGSKFGLCGGDSCVDLTVEGPCECSKVEAVTELKFLGVTDRPINLWIDLDWKLRCTGGEGDCNGEIEVLKPKRRTDIVAVSKQRIGCKGDCDTIRGGSMRFRFKSKNDLYVDERGGERFSFLVRTACLVGGKRVGVRTQPMTIVFKPNGKVDKAKSDLDADGKPDRKK